MSQYGFLPEAREGAGLRHVVPVKADGAVGRLLDDATFAPEVRGAEDGVLRRRRAATLRYCVDLELTPILKNRDDRPSDVVYWIDVGAPLEAPLVLALRAALASPDELNARDRTVQDWIAPLAAEREANVVRALSDVAKAVFKRHWAVQSESASDEYDERARPVIDYQIAHLSKLIATLSGCVPPGFPAP